MITTYSLHISAIDQETALCRTITFAIPSELQDVFQYQPGQYLTLSKPGTSDVRRCYSICSLPGDEGLQIGVKKVENGLMSTYLVEKAKVGDKIEVKVPEGNFSVSTNPLSAKQYVFVAGGSGITPIRSMIGHILNQEPLSKVALLYGNRDEPNIIFDRYFNTLAADARFTLINCLQDPAETWRGEKGLLTREKIYALIQGLPIRYDTSEYYICGPKPMMDNAMQAFKSLGVADDRVHAEYFQADVSQPIIKSQQSRGVQLLLKEGNETIEVKPGQSILDAALVSGVDLPYSCKQGVCASCKMKLVGGTVDQTVNLSLNDKEKSNGYILTCCSYPTSDKVSIDCREKPAVAGMQRRMNRRMALVAGILFGVLLLGAMAFPTPSNIMALGPMNTGHETLTCTECHSPAKGTVVQQLTANFKHFTGQRPEAVAFGTDDVDNKKCQSCHKRPNDRHPMHRFKEPRFKDARLAIGAERCESCHSEHQGTRLTVQDLTYCSHCHQDTELTDDPLDITHTELISSKLWSTCLQCHDFHGNHVMEVAHQMKDTIPISLITEYAQGGKDPYSSIKTHTVDDIEKAIKEMRK